MRPRSVRVVVRTPHRTVLDTEALAVRVPTITGHVGLRPRMERLVLPVETGLVLIRTGAGVTFVGSAGGLLAQDGCVATLLTPLGVVGEDAETVQQALEVAVAAPDAEWEVRTRLGQLQGRLLTELRRERAPHEDVGDR